MSNFELGYTPANLRKLIKDNSINQADIYKRIPKSRAAFERYLHDADDERHATMPHQVWLKTLKIIEEII